MLFGCTLITGPSGDPPTINPPENEPDGLIYNGSSELSIVISDGVSESAVTELWEGIGYETGVYPKIINDTDPVAKHEIVIGRADRDVSREAYKRLSEVEKTGKSDIAVLFYSDGASLAVAYEEDRYGKSLGVALSELVQSYVRSELVLEKNFVHKFTYDLYEMLKKDDNELREEKWRAFKESLPTNADAITSAFRELYDLYDENLVLWMASLYDPDVCICDSLYGLPECVGEDLCGTGGFYYTLSSKGAFGQLPNVEACHGVYNYVTSAGLAQNANEYFPKEILEKMGSYVYNLQDEDGYFYHPHWGKNIGDGRRGRDLERASSLLRALGIEPKYSSIISTSKKGLSSPLGSDSVTLVSRISAVNESVPEHMQSLEAFKKYLKNLNVETSSYNAGSVIGTQISQLRALEKKTGIPFLQTVGDFFDSTQRADNGIWHEKTNYFGVNGLMKIVAVYQDLGREFPRAELALKSAVAAITSDERVGAIVDVWNPWFALDRLLQNIEQHKSKDAASRLKAEFFVSLPAAIKATTAKTAKFKKADGAFSHLIETSISSMQGEICAVPGTVESDMDGAVIASTGMVGSITNILGTSHIRIFGSYESALFLEALEAAQPVRKAPTGHNLGDWVINEKESCTDKGTKTKYCLDEGCDFSITVNDTESVTEHTVESFTPNNDSTCNAYGTMTGVCSVCNNSVTVENPLDEPNGEHDFSLNIVSDKTLKREESETFGAVYYKSCSVCLSVSGSETFTLERGELTSLSSWDGFSYIGYTESYPVAEGGSIPNDAYAYITAEDENSFIRFERRSDNRDQVIYLGGNGLTEGATKYVYEVDLRFGGAKKVSSENARIFNANILTGGNAYNMGKYEINYMEYSSYLKTADSFGYENAKIEEGIFYTLRYEYTVADTASDGAVTYDVRAFVNGAQILETHLTSTVKNAADGPSVAFVMYAEKTVDELILDFDNYKAYTE